MTSKTPTIKARIWKYMEKHDLTYEEMNDRLGAPSSPSQLYRWLQNPNENYSSKVERSFNELVRKK